LGAPERGCRCIKCNPQPGHADLHANASNAASRRATEQGYTASATMLFVDPYSLNLANL
jgi:hypothetical protein